ncbi:MAG: ketosynthase [Gammaproteobacteria bacterium]|nr:ketosynthase [Gammaproteobacteria bacterium]
MRWKTISLLLAMAYPILTHFAIASGSASLTIASVILLAVVVLGPGLIRGSWVVWLAIPLVMGLILLLIYLDLPSLPLYGPPVLITGFTAWLFGRTLAPGSTPLIEQFARLMRPPDQELEPAIVVHARRVTVVWTVLLATLSVLNLLLAMVAVPAGILVSVGIHPPFQVTQTVWSLFANVLNYVILVGLFVGEYAYRRFRFPNLPYTGMVDFLRRAANLRPWNPSEQRRLSDRR